jgi:hypothetical protein
MSLLSRIFPSRAQKRLLSALRRCDAVFRDHFAWESVRLEVRAHIYSPTRRKLQLGLREVDAANAVLYAVMRLSASAATSGRNHAYRGKLSMIGASYRGIALVAMELLVANGFMTDADARHEAAVIDEDVRGAG